MNDWSASINDYVFLDTETTGLDYFRHGIIELAYAIGDGPIKTIYPPEATRELLLEEADPEAMAINKYYERYSVLPAGDWVDWQRLYEDLKGKTVVGANPRFDVAMIEHQAQRTLPCFHRLFDIQAFATGRLTTQTRFMSFRDTALTLQAMGHKIDDPDHTAAGDVHVTRQVFKAVA